MVISYCISYFIIVLIYTISRCKHDEHMNAIVIIMVCIHNHAEHQKQPVYIESKTRIHIHNVRIYAIGIHTREVGGHERQTLVLQQCTCKGDSEWNHEGDET